MKIVFHTTIQYLNRNEQNSVGEYNSEFPCNDPPKKGEAKLVGTQRIRRVCNYGLVWLAIGKAVSTSGCSPVALHRVSTVRNRADRW